ncbi:MAG TPA: tetratricopeptide repeat protein [Gemmatimonadaceae bacterium]|nr:tetratricopeptide repeat protein [Gemmatimonadaceae bacterium]
MRYATRRIAAATLVVAAGAGGAVLTGRHRQAARAEAAAAAASRAAARVEAERRDQEIALYDGARTTDAYSATFPSRLAALYLQRGRETGDFADVERAEREARSSLALRTQHNGGAFVLLASSLLAQHRFSEARDVARQLVAGDPDVPAYRALLGETQLELGDYDGARAAFDSIPIDQRRSPSVAARLARWAELLGRDELARSLLVTARAGALADGRLPREQAAWFALRLGDFDLRRGRLASAERELADGLRAAPDDYRLLAALARLEALRRRWRQVVDCGDRSLASALDPATLGLVSDAHAALGHAEEASEYARAMEVAVLQQPGAFHRAWSLFLLDHAGPRGAGGGVVAAVLAKAEQEIVGRRDVYGYDLLAWALHHAGRDAEAREAMGHALALGTRDAALYYHAGVIAAALGDAPAARRDLSRALEINPRFHHTQPARARAMLDSLDALAVRQGD